MVVEMRSVVKRHGSTDGGYDGNGFNDRIHWHCGESDVPVVVVFDVDGVDAGRSLAMLMIGGI